MLTLHGISCNSDILRSQLKHTWLENQLTNKSEDDIVLLWLGPGWPALVREFHVRVSEAGELVKDFEDGFSPAQLVDRLKPLSALADDTKKAIRQAVHAVYLERSGIADLKKPMENAVTALSGALSRFFVAWEQPVSEQTEQEMRKAWRDLYRCAECLRDLLDRLPRGIVLP